MVRLLLNCINRPVVVSSPTLFGEKAARECILVGVEPGGLWLLGEKLLPATAPVPADATPVFVPFQHILYLVPAASATGDAATPEPRARSPRRRRP